MEVTVVHVTSYRGKATAIKLNQLNQRVFLRRTVAALRSSHRSRKVIYER